MSLPRQFLVMCLIQLVCLTTGLAAERSEEPDPPADISAADQVRQLIEQLGAAEFSERERAQAQLADMALVAFEALQEVRDHEDVEIRMRARRLLRVLRNQLILDSDIDGLEEILTGYAELEEEQRAERLESLGILELEQAIPLLCRFARFEESEVLAKRAALLAMSLDYPEENSQREALADLIHQSTGLGKRTAVRWLSTFADSLSKPASQLDAWEEFQQQEQRQPDISPEILRQFSQIHVDVLARAGRNDDALELAKRIAAFGIEAREDLASLSDWLIKRSLWELFDQIVETNRETFEADRLLLYRLAEVQLENGAAKQAAQTAERAFQLPLDDKELVKVSKLWRVLQSDAAIHLIVASELRDRGLFDWSEREYRQALATDVAPDFVDIKARVWLAEMLHDQLQDGDAADVLAPLVEAAAQDEKIRRTLIGFSQLPASIKSRMHFFRACHYEQQHDVAAQMKELLAGVDASPTDADVLIAMYRVKDPSAEWRAKTSELILQASRKSGRDIQRWRQRWEARRAVNQESDRTRRDLAQKLNDFAWLVGNTEGDGEQALRHSKESLRLEPGTAGYLDTLARCYYRLNDHENAVKYQRQAVRRDPHSGQMNRQLELFENALAAARQQ